MFEIMLFDNVIVVFILLILVLSFVGYIIKFKKVVTKEQLTKIKKDGMISTTNNKSYVIFRLINILKIIAREKN